MVNHGQSWSIMVNHNLPIIAIVGGPNVGKSTLLNKIARERLAVTSDLPGTTRDRQYLDTSFNGVNFTLIDTAGLSFERGGELENNIQKQLEVAISEADAIILVVDGKQPVQNLEQKALLKFRKIKKPTVLAVNKVDSPKNREQQIEEFKKLGIKPLFPISSVTGSGVGDLLEYIAELVATSEKSVEKDKKLNETISVAIVGKPNVGKSSIFNAILKDERAVVSVIPGTTRTAIDDKITIEETGYTFIDTAGLKKKVHRQHEADIFGGFQTFKSIRRSNVCLFIIDASEPITKQDLIIAREIIDQNKGAVLIANKIDLLEGSKKQLQIYLSQHFPFLWMCPVFFVSAASGQGLEEAIKAIKPIYDARQKRIDDEALEKFLQKKLKQAPPRRLLDQKIPKVFSLRQIDVSPPMFELLVNHPAAISKQFRDFLKNSIIRDLNYWGMPIVLKLRGKK